MTARSNKQVGRKKKWLRVLALLVSASIAGLLLAELGLRLVGHNITPFLMRDPELGWCNRPSTHVNYTKEGDGLIVTNSMGMRDRERAADKPASTFRILVIGDSMTMGAEVGPDETYCAVAEKLLEDAVSREVEVLNLGVVGYAPLQQLLLLQRMGFDLQPDLVVVAVFLDNDIGGSSKELRVNPEGTPWPVLAGEALVVDATAAVSAHAEFHSEPLHSVRAYSHVYHLAYDLLVDGQRRPAMSNAVEVPVSRFVYASEWTAPWRDAWAKAERVWLEIVRECRSRDVSVALLSIPAGVAVHEPTWQRFAETYPVMRSMSWDVRGPERRLEAFATRQGIPLFEAAPIFREATQQEQLYLGPEGYQVGHCNARGHEVLAAFLCSELLKRDPPYIR